MAREAKTVYEITDDLTGETISEDEAVNITFSYGGQDYELDLHKDNAKKLDEFLAPYIDKARRPRRGSAFFKAPVDRPGAGKWKREKYGQGGRLTAEQAAEWDALPAKEKAKYQ